MLNKDAFENVEMWNPITYKGIDYTEGYKVSNYGNVKSLKGKNNKLLAVFKTGAKNKRYLTVSLSHNNKSTCARVHVLVCNAFLRERTKGEVIDHIDSNRDNNKLSNLQIITKINFDMLTDETKITFGKYKGKKLAEVPDSYLMWYWNLNSSAYKRGTMSYYQGKLLMAYIEDNLDSLDEN